MSSKALDDTYHRYNKKAEFFLVYIVNRDPEGYWLNVADREDLRNRAQQARDCPSTQGLTVPRLIDDLNGSGDYLYRAYPFRVCVVDIDGNIAYHSTDGEADHDNPELYRVIGQELDALLANGGRVVGKLVAAQRSDRIGAAPAGFWLPRTGYFTAPVPPADGNKPVNIIDAQGYVVQLPKREADRLQYQRRQVVRCFTPGSPAPKRPVVLIFVNGKTLPGAKELEAWYQRDRARADFYLLYAAAQPGEMPQKAKAAVAWAKSAGLSLPCLLDDPENDVTFAYGSQAPRVVVIGQHERNAFAIRYISRPGEDGFVAGISEAARALQ